MIYLKHDFYSNFTDGVKSGDTDLIRDMVINEISDIIVYKPEKVIELLNTVGVKTPVNTSDERMVKNITANLNDNRKLVKGIAFLIADNNGIVKEQKNPRKSHNWIRSVDKITEGVETIGFNFNTKARAKVEFEQELMDAIKTKSDSLGDRKRRHTDNSGKNFLIFLLIIGAGIGIYFFIKHRRKVAAKEMGIEGGANEANIAEASTAKTAQEARGATESSATPTPSSVEAVPASTPLQTDITNGTNAGQ